MKPLLKNSAFALIALASLAGTSARADDNNFTGHTYVVAHRFEHPLDTFDGCGPNTYAGSEAAEVAYRDAMLQCRSDFNSDCVSKGAQFRSVMSQEFIGYKYCEASVTVVGFRLSN